MSPVHVSLEQDHAVYVEPNLWVRHPRTVARAAGVKPDDVRFDADVLYALESPRRVAAASNDQQFIDMLALREWQTSDKVKNLRRKASALKDAMAELMLEKRKFTIV